MQDNQVSRWKPAFGLLCLAAVVRLVSLGLYPLMDTSEARYAEIARKMAASGDWVTPWFDPGVPFWGKPPLTFWLDAMSFKVFGINEFTARIPHWLTAMFVIGVLWRWLESNFDRTVATVSCLLLMTSALYLVTSGAVLTDTALTFGIVLVMCGFWNGLHAEPSRRTPSFLLLFAGTAIGLLAKGPVTLVLAGVPIAAWILWRRRIMETWQGFPWIAGILLTLLITLPWYVAAEMKTPGFLDYFFIGEHWRRFTVPDWQGDLYGTAHDYPHGFVWIFLIQSCFPWIVLVPLAGLVYRRVSNASPSKGMHPSIRGYLLMWALWPALFFTFAGNVLWTYVLPGLPALAALCGFWMAQNIPRQRLNAWLAVGTLGFLTLFVVFVGFVSTHAASQAKTAKFLVERYEQSHDLSEPLIYLHERPFSAEFYSDGRAILARNTEQLNDILDAHGGSAFVALSDSQDRSSIEHANRTVKLISRYRDIRLLRITSAHQKK